MLPVDYVFLEFSPQMGQAALREISGHEEWMVNGTNTLVAIHLLDRMLVDLPGAVCQPGTASRLAAADRDRLLAAIYQRSYGRQVVSTLNCRSCGNPFDLDFDLPELIEAIRPAGENLPFERQGDQYLLPDGSRFRLPTGEDELAVAQLAPEQAAQAMMQRCFPDGKKPASPAVLEALQAAAPLIDLELEARCAGCGQDQAVHFNLQHYLLAAIQAEQPRLAREVHLLASAYSWGMDAILGLTRSQRRMYVALIEEQIARPRQRRPL